MCNRWSSDWNSYLSNSKDWALNYNELKSYPQSAHSLPGRWPVSRPEFESQVTLTCYVTWASSFTSLNSHFPIWKKNGGNNSASHRIAKRIKLDYLYKQRLTLTKCYDNYLLWPLFNNETTGYIKSHVLKASHPNWVRSIPYQDKCPIGHIPLLAAWTCRGSWEGRLTQFGQHIYAQIGPTI